MATLAVRPAFRAQRLSNATSHACSGSRGQNCRRPLVVRSGLGQGGEPARPVALPSGALWLLDTWQDQFYSVRGERFVIQRAEGALGDEPIRKHKWRGKRTKPGLVKVPEAQPTGGLLRHALWEQPSSLMLISDGPLVDVDAEAVEDEHATWEGPTAAVQTDDRATDMVPPAVNCTGIVHVPSTDTQEDQNTHQTSSASPRRTKMLRFTCMADGCKTVNVKPMNPIAFHQGTAFAQCAKCGKWHLIRDHLNLWDQMKGPLPFAKRQAAKKAAAAQAKASGPLKMEDVPEALRISPEDLDWLGGPGSRSGGYPARG